MKKYLLNAFKNSVEFTKKMLNNLNKIKCFVFLTFYFGIDVDLDWPKENKTIFLQLIFGNKF